MEGSSTYVREKRSWVGVGKGRHGIVEIKLLCLMYLAPFLKLVYNISPYK